jgi:hypothetical protein
MPISDRAKIGLTAFIRRTIGLDIIGPRVDYLAAYQCKVVVQNADGTLELQPDNAALPGYSKVPIRYGVPGISATVAAGARVLLEFAGGDPQKPIAGGAFDVLMQAIATAVGTSGSPAGATAAAAAIVTAILAYQASVVAKLSTITKTA